MSTSSPTLAVVSQTGETLSFFSLATGERTSHLTSVVPEPHELCHDTSRQLLYMTHAYRHGNYWAHGDNAHEVSVIDIPTRKVVDVIDTRPAKGPHGMAIDTARDILYVSVEELPDQKVGGGVIGIDLKTRKVVKAVPSGYTSHWFVMTPDGRRAYTCNKTAEFISVVDLENGKMVGKIDTPEGTEEPSISPDGRFAYFPAPGYKFGKNAERPRIEVIDTQTDEIVKSIEMKFGGIPVHVTSRGQVLVGQYNFPEKNVQGPLHPMAAYLAIYDGTTHELVGQIQTGLLPLTIRSSTDGKFGFVANVSTGTVDTFDLDEMSLVRTIVVDDKRRTDKNGHVGAHGMAYIE